MPALIVGLILLIGATTVADYLTDRYSDARADRYAARVTTAEQFRAQLLEAGYGIRSFILSGQPNELMPYQLARRVLDDLAPKLLGQFGEDPQATAAAYATIQKSWTDAIAATLAHQEPQAAAALFTPEVAQARALLLRETSGYLDRVHGEADDWSAESDVVSRAYQIFQLLAVGIAALAMIYAFGRIIRAIDTGFAAREQTEQLFAMADTLQSAVGLEDLTEVLRATAGRLLPEFGGALYVFNNSRDRLDRAAHWGVSTETSTDHLAPNSCWALKRGKPHLNGIGAGALRCNHIGEEGARAVTLEIPMAARGELYGMLEISADPTRGDALARLQRAKTVAMAMADAMSLALSSLALRERLRNQALRDALTGLYNRRFLEEMLDRMCMEAERRQAPIAAIMIDLDHFKRLNDTHGHSAGDAVLRDTGSAILSCLRATDVACRYGGEELAVLLPDCSLAFAAGKAEQIRARIAEVSQAGGLAVTASLGVACLPETCGSATELLASADAALYRAKQLGRDRVEVAPHRTAPPAQRLSLIEPDKASRPN